MEREGGGWHTMLTFSSACPFVTVLLSNSHSSLPLRHLRLLLLLLVFLLLVVGEAVMKMTMMMMIMIIIMIIIMMIISI